MNQHSILRDDLPQPLSLLSRENIRTLQQTCGKEPCFQTDTRYFCNDAGCEWRKECRRLVAEWQR